MKHKNQRSVYIAWGVLFLICAGMGFVPAPGTGWVLTVFSLAFFVPPAILLYRGEKKSVDMVCRLSIASLGLTLFAIILNVLAVHNSKAAGQVLYALLVILSTPMVCSQFWALSIFCWACLMVVSLKIKKAARA